jgi:hypothetical protein
MYQFLTGSRCVSKFALPVLLIGYVALAIIPGESRAARDALFVGRRS